jgi:hypothetical protein
VSYYYGKRDDGDDQSTSDVKLLLFDWMYLVMLYSYTELKVQLFVSFVIFLIHHWFHPSVTDISPLVDVEKKSYEMIERSNLGEKLVGCSD